MRFDLEQFLALTMALGTAGAVGVGIYSTQQGDAVVSSAEAPREANADDDFPEAAPVPKAPPKPEAARSSDRSADRPAATPTPMPALDEAPEVLEQTPGPQVESMRW